MPRETFKNTSSSLLDGGIDDTQTTLDVDSGGAFPASGQFRIRIDDELLLCTSRSSDTLTVVRGIESSAPASHLDDAPVTLILTAGSIQQYVRDGSAFFGDTNRPLLNSLTNASGATIALADFTWVNQETATASNYASGGIFMEAPTSSADDIRLLKRTAPGTPYSVVACLRTLLAQDSSDLATAGICFRKNSNGSMIALSITQDNSSPRVAVYRYTDEDTIHSTAVTRKPFAPSPNETWLKIEDDGTDLNFYVGMDGIHWIEVHSEGRGSFFSGGPDEVGWFLNNALNTLYPIHGALLHWSGA